VAVGTTADFVSTRADIISGALRKVKMWPEDGNPPLERVQDAIRKLNRLLRAEDLKGTQQSKHLWALSTNAVILVAGQFIYTTTETLPNNILDLHSVMFRNTSGDDIELDIITSKQYAEIANKNDTGDPKHVWLRRDRLLASQKLYVWPTPASIGTASVVEGSDALQYTCIQTHTSATLNKPITGTDYTLYWKQTGSGGSAWAASTDYTNSELLYLTYKRPLFDFDGPYDNPDFPAGWDRYLIHKLALDLAPESTISVEDRLWLKRELQDAELDLFPSSKENATTNHNKAVFF